MTAPQPKSDRNLDGTGAAPIPWERVRDRLNQGLTQAPETGGPNRHTCWLTTIGADGRPHVRPLGALWLEGTFFFNTGAGTRKARDLAHNPNCVLTVATHEFDLVFEGTATIVTDPAKAERVAAAYRAQGWEATVAAGTASLTA